MPFGPARPATAQRDPRPPPRPATVAVTADRDGRGPADGGRTRRSSVDGRSTVVDGRGRYDPTSVPHRVRRWCNRVRHPEVSQTGPAIHRSACAPAIDRSPDSSSEISSVFVLMGEQPGDKSPAW